MRFPDGRPDQIEDYLVKVRTGQWFTWSDPSSKIYANLLEDTRIRNHKICANIS